MKQWHIYGLIDPRIGLIRYVGKSNNPNARLSQHLADKSDRRLGRWIRKLVKEGVTPDILILQIGDDNLVWQDAERKWISYYRVAGNDLLNHTDGGEGFVNPVHGPDNRFRWPKGKPMHPNAKAALAKSLIGNQRTKGRILSKEERQIRSDALKHRPKTPEHKEKLRQAALRRWAKKRGEIL